MSPFTRRVAALCAIVAAGWSGLAPLPAPAAPAEPSAAAAARAIDAFGRIPLRFERNDGQADPRIGFLARGPHYRVLLMPGAALLALTPRAAEAASIRIDFVGSAGSSALEGVDVLPGVVSQLIGNDPTRWLTGIPTFARVMQPGLYRGIDLVYYGDPSRLEYDLIVHPGADPGAIAMHVDGAERMRLDPDGNLKLAVGAQEISLLRPVVYQKVDGIRRAVDGGYVLSDGMHVGFRIGSYDRDVPLVIDPVLAYSTYLGGTGNESALAVAVDASGSAYVGGASHSVDFPVTGGVVQPVYASNNGLNNPDGFVAKLNPAGNAIVYATYIGGSCTDIVYAIAVNSSGEAHLTGQTGSGLFNGNPDCSPLGAPDPVFKAFPQVSSLQPAYGGLGDAFVAKLNHAGSALLFSSFLGGNHQDAGRAVALDAASNMYVAGETSSTNFPTAAGALQSANAGGMDAFVTKVSATHALIYSTYVGGSDIDRARGIAVDPAGHAYVTGMTASGSVTACNVQSVPGPAFPTTASALQQQIAPSPPTGVVGCGAFPGGLPVTPNPFDAFVFKLNPAGSGLVYSTYLGGGTAAPGTTAFDDGHAIAVDASGQAHVTGATAAANFPTVNPFQSGYQGGTSPSGDAFVSKLDATGSALLWSTYLGGPGFDEGNGIAVNAAGETHVVGTTHGGLPAVDPLPGTSNLPLPFPLPSPPPTTFGGAFVLKLNAAGNAPVFLSSLAGTTTGAALALDALGNAYVTGDTIGFLQVVGAAQPLLAGGGDGFVAKLGSAVAQATSTTIVSDNPDPSAVGQAVSVVFTVNAASGTPAGTVIVSADTLETCSASVAAGSCNLSFGSTGTRTLTAAYQGGSGFAPSTSAPATHSVVHAGSATTILSDNPDPSLPGQTVTIVFNVSGASSTPTGQVTVNSSSGEPCSGALIAGTGSCTIVFAATGNRTLVASYGGNAIYNASASAAQPHAVIRDGVSVSLTSSLNPSQFGQAVTFTASVVGNTPGMAVPTGSVSFANGPTQLATVPLGAAGLAMHSSSVLAVGNHPISASYSGDALFVPGAPALLTQQVLPPPLTTGSFVIGDGEAVIGRTVTFWGSQWAKLNRLSGGASPNGFKGFVTTAGVPTCAGGPNWLSAPGNSSNPPAAVPAFVTVLVTSAVSKTGSVIAGNRPQMAVVRTHPGYGPSPGHPGTGTVVSLVCP